MKDQIQSRVVTLARRAAFSALTWAGVLRALLGLTGLLGTGPQLLPLLLKYSCIWYLMMISQLVIELEMVCETLQHAYLALICQ